MLVYDAYIDLPNGGIKLLSCCANAANCEKGFCAGGISTGGALEDNKSMTHNSNKENKQINLERPFILPNKGQPLTPR